MFQVEKLRWVLKHKLVQPILRYISWILHSLLGATRFGGISEGQSQDVASLCKNKWMWRTNTCTSWRCLNHQGAADRVLLVHTEEMVAPAETGMGLRAAEITANAVYNCLSWNNKTPSIWGISKHAAPIRIPASYSFCVPAEPVVPKECQRIKQELHSFMVVMFKH